MRGKGSWVVVGIVLSGLAWFGLSRAAGPGPGTTRTVAARPIPRLVDLGAKTCIPCKAMAPILDGLRDEYAGRMDVVFIDVWKDREAADNYAIRIIPTQVFFGADGRELARHEGFMGKEEILAQWNALGVGFPAP